MWGEKKKSQTDVKRYLGTRERVKLAKKKRWKSVKPPMLLKVEVPVWFSSPSPWQHCQQEKVEREKDGLDKERKRDSGKRV